MHNKFYFTCGNVQLQTKYKIQNRPILHKITTGIYNNSSTVKNPLLFNIFGGFILPIILSHL
jgi:hypothetical protein